MPRAYRLGFAAAAVVSIALPVGCGDSEVVDLTIETFAQTYDAAYCDYLVRCNAMPDLAACKRVVGPDENIIQALNSTLYGNLTFDDAGAEACIAAVKDATCDSSGGFAKAIRDVCTNAFTNKGKAETPCFVDLECETGLECDLDPACMSACCPGKCSTSQTGVPVGGDCTTDPCIADAFCDRMGDMPNDPGVCKAKGQASAACNAGNECADGLTCDGGSRTCFQQSRTGEQCNPDLANNPCLNANEYCDATSSKCTALPKPGQPCVTSGSRMNQCAIYALCQEGTCQKRPDVGEPCMNDNCLGNLECRAPTMGEPEVCSALGATVSCVLN